jgi:hypothetical protein
MPYDVALGYSSLKINELWRSSLTIYEHSPFLITGIRRVVLGG